VEAAVRIIEETGNRHLILLHCVSNYPANPADCNLRALETLASAFHHPVGFSDHTLGIHVAVAAVARGACVLEKHLTLDKTMPGPDHRCSLDTGEFASMVAAIRMVESALGDGVKRPVQSETETRGVVRKTIVAARAIQTGAMISHEDLALRRSAAGLTPAFVPLIIGRRANQDIPANCRISLDMLQ